MNTPQSSKKKGRNRIGTTGDSIGQGDSEILSPQEAARFVLVRIIRYADYYSFVSM